MKERPKSLGCISRVITESTCISRMLNIDWLDGAGRRFSEKHQCPVSLDFLCQAFSPKVRACHQSVEIFAPKVRALLRKQFAAKRISHFNYGYHLIPARRYNYWKLGHLISLPVSGQWTILYGPYILCNTNYISIDNDVFWLQLLSVLHSTWQMKFYQNLCTD